MRLIGQGGVTEVFVSVAKVVQKVGRSLSSCCSSPSEWLGLLRTFPPLPFSLLLLSSPLRPPLPGCFMSSLVSPVVAVVTLLVVLVWVMEVLFLFAVVILLSLLAVVVAIEVSLLLLLL